MTIYTINNTIILNVQIVAIVVGDVDYKWMEYQTVNKTRFFNPFVVINVKKVYMVKEY